MIPIYAILLYLQQIFSGGTYTQDQMNAIINTNSSQINQIQQNTNLMNQINTQYDNDANIIVATNPDLNP